MMRKGSAVVFVINSKTRSNTYEWNLCQEKFLCYSWTKSWNFHVTKL